MAGLVAAGVLGTAAMGLLASPAGAGTGASAAATAQAHKALLVLSDLPAGWTSTPSSSSGSGSGSVSGGFAGAPPQLATCLGVPRQIVQFLPPEINSAQMSDQGGTLQFQDTISIFPSTKFAQEEYAAVSSHKAAGCLRSLLNSELGGSSGTSGSSGSGTKAGGLSVTKTTSPKGTTAFDLDMSLTGQGTSRPTRTELILFVHGQLVDTLDFTGYGSSAPPQSLVQHLISLARSRL
jgi:hypothetical protein